MKQKNKNEKYSSAMGDLFGEWLDFLFIEGKIVFKNLKLLKKRIGQVIYSLKVQSLTKVEKSLIVEEVKI